MSRSATAADAVRLAVGTLTAIPVRPPGRVDPVVAGWAMTLAPIAFLPVLLPIAVVVWAAARLGVAELLVAAVAVTLLALATRGLHLDGLADTCDGLACGPDRQRALAAMRTGDTGPSGVAAIVCTLLVQVAALASLFGSTAGMVLAGVAVLASRHVLGWGCLRRVPPARTDGLGAPVASSVPTARLAGAAVVAVLTAGALAWAVDGHWWHGPLVVAVAVLAGLLVLGRARPRVGGMTGDVLGAMVEISLPVGLTVASILTSSPLS